MMFFSPLSLDRRKNNSHETETKTRAHEIEERKSSFDAFFRSFLLSFKTEEEAGINCPPFFPHLSVLGGKGLFLIFLRFFFQD